MTVVVVLVVLFLGIYFALWLFKPIIQSIRNRPATEYEWQFVDPTAGSRIPKKLPFPSLFDQDSVYLSIILPAYNEELRLEPTLKETVTYLQRREVSDPEFTWEIIVVDDGSQDKTGEVTLRWVKKYSTERIRLLQLKENQGKGGAVQQGMLHARGQYLLFADADGATDIEDLAKLEKAIKSIENKGLGIAIGSRAHLQDKAVVARKWYRNLLMYGFHAAVWLLAVRGIMDTQCGFKLFTRKAAQIVFFNQNLRRWSFDVELLFVAQRQRIPIRECSVNWQEVPGSKLDLVSSSLMMARDLIVIRLAYTLKIWNITSPFSSSNRHLRAV